MRRLGTVFLGLLTPVLLALAVGCGTQYRQIIEPVNEPEGAGSTGGGKAVAEELKSDGWATLEGRITYDGDKPPDNPDATNRITKDQNVCLCKEAKDRGEDHEQIWICKETKDGIGVANVVLFLKAPQGKFFP